MRRFWEWLGLNLGKHAGMVAVIGLALTFLLGLGVVQFKFSTSNSDYLNKSDALAVNNQRYTQLFGGDPMAVLFTMNKGKTVDDLFTPANTAEMQRVDGRARQGPVGLQRHLAARRHVVLLHPAPEPRRQRPRQPGRLTVPLRLSTRRQPDLRAEPLELPHHHGTSARRVQHRSADVVEPGVGPFRHPRTGRLGTQVGHRVRAEPDPRTDGHLPETEPRHQPGDQGGRQRSRRSPTTPSTRTLDVHHRRPRDPQGHQHLPARGDQATGVDRRGTDDRHLVAHLQRALAAAPVPHRGHRLDLGVRPGRLLRRAAHPCHHHRLAGPHGGRHGLLDPDAFAHRGGGRPRPRRPPHPGGGATGSARRCWS